MEHEESNIQKSSVKWFYAQYPKYAPLLWAIPNGGRRDKKTGKWLKLEGVRRGASDMVLYIPSENYHCLHIEFKSAKGRQTPEQKQMQRLLEEKGYKYIICRSFDEFEKEINNYLQEKYKFKNK